jgi:hypothetical protein
MRIILFGIGTIGAAVNSLLAVRSTAGWSWILHF